jgi:hypothetical protein
MDKAKILQALRERETQRMTARKIRFLRGKINTGSMTLVSVENNDGTISDLTNKSDIKQDNYEK